ncbi:MAG: hypothetical protein HOP96_04535 [Sphingomonas sp.]|nr:hypothetical protein [Sphingomonas sp.]
MANTISQDIDRLPWLTDDRASARKRSGKWLLIALLALMMAGVAAGAFWFGMTRTQAPIQPQVIPAPVETAPVAPQPAPTEPRVEEIQPVPMPEVEPAPVPAPVIFRQQQEVRQAIEPAPERRIVRRSAPVSRPSKPARREAVAASEKPANEKKPLSFSNPWDSSAASGKMVRIGTYSTLRQGKVAWSRLAKAFPGMKKLPAVVTDIPSLRNGRVYYRLQVGTTSQAHSEVLCQRMRAIGQSCVVVDLAGARKGSWDERQPVGL